MSFLLESPIQFPTDHRCKDLATNNSWNNSAINFKVRFLVCDHKSLNFTGKYFLVYSTGTAKFTVKTIKSADK